MTLRHRSLLIGCDHIHTLTHGKYPLERQK